MSHALRASRMTPIWVLLGTLLIVGFAAGAAGRSHASPTGLVAAYVDVNGNGIDDTCETGEIVADLDAAADEDAAVDLDGDGTISVSEAAQSDRIGGAGCNHGGYVSWVAQGSCADPTPTPTPAQAIFVTGDAPEGTTDETTTESTSCDETAEQPTETPTDSTEQAADTPCVEVPPPDHDPALDEQKNGHGKWVSLVAQSEAVGGKNCNHGGAVSEAAKKDHDAAKAARDAAKAERDAEREARKAAREAAKAAGGHGKGNPHRD
ncbi:MAG TPA: hypothetical protein VFN41_03425 [Candidatus Limnocylindrales bacterium]|nr:hypothetical protein [Candidatus Limnocylindrales bacterium]